NISEAQALLQRRAPDPAGVPRADALVRWPRLFERCGRTQDAVGGQPLPPAFPRHAGQLADELGACAGVVDVQVGAQLAAVLEFELVDEPVFPARRADQLFLEPDDAGAL